jgi:hypothetical protein
VTAGDVDPTSHHQHLMQGFPYAAIAASTDRRSALFEAEEDVRCACLVRLLFRADRTGCTPKPAVRECVATTKSRCAEAPIFVADPRMTLLPAWSRFG